MPETPMIPVLRPVYGAEEEAAVVETLRSGWSGLGPRTRAFEEAFAQYLGVSAVVGTVSCTAALQLAVHALGLHPGDEVILPSLNFVSGAHVIRGFSAYPMFADVCADTLTLDPADVARKITKHTRAIMVMHYSGRPCDMDEIRDLAGGLPVIEDAAHACGASYKGKPAGTLGDFGCFSFHAVKNLSMGEGGAIVPRDPDWIDKFRRRRWLGISRDTYSRSDQAYEWRYDVVDHGYKAHLSDLHASVGLVQLAKLTSMNARRREIASIYRETLADLPWIQHPITDDDDYRSSWHLYVIRVPGGVRDRLFQHMHERGIQLGVHYRPLHQHPYYASYPSLCPVTDALTDCIVTLPLHLALTDRCLDRITNALQSFTP